MKHVALAVFLVVFSHPALTATIVVDETTCTLVDSIESANTDTAVGGCATGSGADTIELTTDVTLTSVHNDDPPWGSNGLPAVTGAITLEGNDFTVERGAVVPLFRIFAVESSGTLTLNDVALRNGWALYGGAIWNEGTLELVNTVVSDNGSIGGGGIASIVQGGSVTLVDSTVSGNSGGYQNGGGIYTYGGTLTVLDSTVSGNGAFAGGGIWSGGTTILTNSTVSGNGATGGGGIVHAGGTLTVTNSTVTGNSASNPGGGIVGPVTLGNSIVAGNTGGSGAGNCNGTINDLGNNFADDDSCGAGFLDIAPGLDFDVTLADNGGPTLTHALFPGSVAQDAAGACGLATDQRGASRDDGACDSGSFELAPAVPASSPFGLVFLGVGLLGCLFVTLGRRPRAAH